MSSLNNPLLTLVAAVAEEVHANENLLSTEVDLDMESEEEEESHILAYQEGECGGDKPSNYALHQLQLQQANGAVGQGHR
jgi:hypothetical protein